MDRNKRKNFIIVQYLARLFAFNNGKNLYNLLMIFWLSSFRYSTIQFLNLLKFTNCLSFWYTKFPQQFSIIFKFEDLAGHSVKTRIFLFAKYCFTLLSRCAVITLKNVFISGNSRRARVNLNVDRFNILLL